MMKTCSRSLSTVAVTFLAALLCGVAGDLKLKTNEEIWNSSIRNLLDNFKLDLPTDFEISGVEENFTLSAWNVSSTTYAAQLKRVCKVAGLDALGSPCAGDCASVCSESSYNVSDVMEKACMWLCEGPCDGNTRDDPTPCKDQMYYYCFKKYASDINAFIGDARSYFGTASSGS